MEGTKLSTIEGRSLLLAAGTAAGALGVTVIVSWLTGRHSLAVALGSDPMPFNTALGFVVLGAAFLALALGRFRLALGGAGVAILYGILTLFQHVAHQSLPIDALFFPARAIDPTAFIVRAAPNTGLAFLLLGTAIGIMAQGRGSTTRTLSALLGAATAIIALVDLVGYALSLKGPGHGLIVPQMALHTAVGLGALGTVILYAGWKSPGGIGNAMHARPGLMAGMTVVLFTVVLAQLLRLQERRQIQKTVEVTAEAFADQLVRSFEGRSLTAISMAKAMTAVPVGGWKTFAEAVVDSAWSRRGVGWIDAKGARWLALAAPDTALRMRPWWPDSAMRAAADTAAKAVMGLSTQGGHTYVGALVHSATRDGERGYFWAVSDVKLALANELKGSSDGFSLRVSDGEHELYHTPGATAMDPVWASSAIVNYPPIRWVVRAAPTPEALLRARSALPIVTLTAGMLVATLLGVSVTLGREARDRAKEIEAAHAQLTTEIHEREAAQAALRVSEEQLRQAQKLEAVGRLAGGIAHDYNNILTVIRGNAQSLLLHEAYEGLGREALEHIDRAAARGGLLTARLLAFSQRQILQPESIDLAALVQGLHDELRQLLGPQVALRLDTVPNGPVVEVDRRWLSQVILDLCFNAREAMPAGGTLWIRSRVADGALRKAYGVNKVTGPAVVLEIEDSGRGMDDATRTRLFEPFFSTKKFGQGAGLALASAYGIVRQSQGEIAVRSTPGEGTRVGIFLPTSASEAAPAAVPIAPGTTVLVAEDEPGVLRFMKRTLEHAGCTVIAGASAEAAIEAMEACGLIPDLLVSDIIMPGISGVELAGEMRLRVPGLAVLFVSAYTSDALKERGIESLGAYLLQKPFTAAELIEQIGRTLSVSARVP
ncbi:MAG TPA: response regulator [Gemmatimonadales bacterium]|nr:response regulator [Gemmatimonadales bacterium]